MLPQATGYGWNEVAHRYYNAETGQFVAQSDIRSALENLIDQSGLNMNALTQSLQDGKISLADWQSGMMREIKLTHTASGALANGGWGQMTQSDWGATGQLIRQQYDYLRNFAKEIADGTQPLDGRMLVRADLYADSSNGTYATIRGRAYLADGFEEERRVLEVKDGNNCDGCVEQAAQGWQPIGTLEPIGSQECITRCRCVFSYRRMTEGGEWEESE